MPSLFRFVIVVAMLFVVSYAGLYILSVYFEPKQVEVHKTVPNVGIRR